MSNDEVEARHRALVADLARLLDVEAGLREVAIPATRDALAAGLGEVLDVEAGLGEIVSVGRQSSERRVGPSTGGGRGGNGTVKWLNSEKGYGFIAMDTGVDLFFHMSAFETDGNKSLEVGQRVQVVIGFGARGPEARHVRLASS